jgi:hypothetical protein
MESELSRRIRELRPRRTWDSVVALGFDGAWRRTEDVWNFPAPPEDYAMPPVLPWTEELRQLALSEYCAIFDRHLEPNEHHEMDWPPQGFLTSSGSWYVDFPLCSEHDVDYDDSCEECRSLDRDGTVVIDVPAEWDWTVEVRTVALETRSDGSTFEDDTDQDRWNIGSTPFDPREVEYGPEKGSPYRAELIRVFWAEERRSLEARG